MDNKTTKDKCCKNCKFFVMHYFKFKLEFLPIDLGHCIHDKIYRYNPTKLREQKFCCPLWEHKTYNETSEAKKIISDIKSLMRRLERTLDKQ